MEEIKKVAEAIANLKLKQVSELEKILKEDYNIEPSVAAIPVTAGAVQNSEEEGSIKTEKTSFEVILKSAGGSKLAVIKLVRELLAIGLKEAKELVDSAPKSLKNDVNKEEAESIQKKLVEAGAEVELK